jgi:hypothetical protein
MAQKIGLFDQMLFGTSASRAAINRNADELSYVGASVTTLHALVQRQAQEILQLRAMVIGLAEVLHARALFDEPELQRAVQASWAQLTAPQPQPQPPPAATDPYRGMPADVPAPPERLVLCPQCGRRVPASRTNITENGEVCDACS